MVHEIDRRTKSQKQNNTEEDDATPSAVSTRKNRVFAAFFAACTVPALPDTAVSGDTLAARLAGVPAASRTVTKPITTPAASPMKLTPNTGIPSKNPGLKKRSRKHSTHVTAIPERTPAGIAPLHQPSASLLTKRTTCFLVAPRQRIIPKNSVRRAILLFMLEVIIKIPAIITIAAKTAATK